MLNKIPHVIIATPGRLWSIIKNKTADKIYLIKYINWLIIDEADRITQQGNFKDVINIIEYLQSKENNVTNDIE